MMNKLPVQWTVFPFVSAAAWGLTISSLLIYWLASGRPVFPSSFDPRIAYISDIGAQTLKPLFIFGTTMTTLSFWVVLFRIHVLSNLSNTRRDPLRLALSTLATLSGVGGSACLVLLAIFDVARHKDIHISCLFVFCLGMLVSAISTAAWDWRWRATEARAEDVEKSDDDSFPTRGNGEVEKLTRLYILNGVIIFEVIFVVAFVALAVMNAVLADGILEWIVAAMFVPYLAMLGTYMK